MLTTVNEQLEGPELRTGTSTWDHIVPVMYDSLHCIVHSPDTNLHKPAIHEVSVVVVIVVFCRQGSPSQVPEMVKFLFRTIYFCLYTSTYIAAWYYYVVYFKAQR